MQSAEAAKKPYTLAEIDNAFGNSEGYVTYNDKGKMIVDLNQMKEDGLSKKDIKIMKKWTALNNKIINAVEGGNQTKLDLAIEKAQSGKFRLLTNATIVSPSEGFTGQTNVNYLSLTACGITYGQTSHANPTASVDKDGYASQVALQSALVIDNYHQIQWPWTDLDEVRRDYGKKNLTGIGGCNEGEFRDQNYIYPPTMPHYHDKDRTESSSGWHTLRQLNEPNPELGTYDAPTFWWDVYTTIWHYNN